MEPDPRMTADQPETLKVASYNIRKAVGADRRHNPERIMRVLAETGADIAVLQEADRRLGERPSALPAGLVEAAGWQVVPVATSRSGIGWHGNAILVSSRIDIIRGARLKLPMLEPRGAVLADLAISGQPLRIIGAHLDLSGLWRPRQIRALGQHVDGQDEVVPTLITGDFNEWRSLPAGFQHLARHFEHIKPGPSFPARWPVAHLDRMFASPELTVEDAAVHRSALAASASDHLPIWAKLKLPPFPKPGDA
jgi:endonuclease/exonuclease/phosphatase family metal-dependent hydrolase